MYRRFLFSSIAVLLTVCSFSSCSRRTVIHRFEPVDVQGWSPNDTIRFTVDSIGTEGCYTPTVGIRTSAHVLYPYRSLFLVVRQIWHQPEQVRTDTVECKLTDEHGNTTGNGVSLYQYEFVQPPVQLEQGSYGNITVSHLMRNDLLQGITEIGIELSRNE